MGIIGQRLVCAGNISPVYYFGALEPQLGENTAKL